LLFRIGAPRPSLAWGCHPDLVPGADPFRNPKQIALNSQRGNALRALVGAALLALPATLSAQDAVRVWEAPAPAVAQRGNARVEARRDSLVRLARAQLGRRYIFGGTTPAGFDCSGFLKYLMRAAGHEIPRTAAQQARAGREIPRDPSQLRAGDILTFGRGGRVTHVGMYVGNGRFIHASTGSRRIVETNLDRPTSSLVRAWYGVRRFLAEDDTATAVAARETGPVRR
jgi:cell wall-associated NlpC family hydrolase